MADIISVQTENRNVALIVVAHNMARDAILEARATGGASLEYTEHFDRIYKAMHRTLSEADKGD